MQFQAQSKRSSALRIGKSLARSKRANVFAARKVHWTLRLSGSANRGVSLARYSALTSSLALKAHCAFNLKQAQRSELENR
ncbi:hypothetical protein CGSMWGv00703Bmash_00260 [Gardnerella pickettii 00703Bmash]|nr:hypothetical protein CGSMWGv00703Bmash_00260 [Gardnerella pickettii 00703Bmash]